MFMEKSYGSGNICKQIFQNSKSVFISNAYDFQCLKGVIVVLHNTTLFSEPAKSLLPMKNTGFYQSWLVSADSSWVMTTIETRKWKSIIVVQSLSEASIEADWEGHTWQSCDFKILQLSWGQASCPVPGS